MTTLRRLPPLWTWCHWMKWMKTILVYHKTTAFAASPTSQVLASDSVAHKRTNSTKSLSTQRFIKMPGLKLKRIRRPFIISWTWILSRLASGRRESSRQMILNKGFHLMINRHSRLVLKTARALRAICEWKTSNRTSFLTSTISCTRKYALSTPNSWMRTNAKVYRPLSRSWFCSASACGLLAIIKEIIRKRWPTSHRTYRPWSASAMVAPIAHVSRWCSRRRP